MAPTAAPTLAFAVVRAAADTVVAGVAVLVKLKHRMSLFVSHGAKIYLKDAKAIV
jgi:hypothetical protein